MSVKYSKQPMASCKNMMMYGRAACEAHKSSSLYRLGAVIAKGRHVICCGHNHDRTRIMGCLESHAHAEMDVAARYLRLQGIFDVPWAQLKGRCEERF